MSMVLTYPLLRGMVLLYYYLVYILELVCNKAEKDWGSYSAHPKVGLQKPSCTKQRCLTE
jgi:hypothetical protein